MTCTMKQHILHRGTELDDSERMQIQLHRYRAHTSLFRAVHTIVGSSTWKHVET